MLVVEGFMRGFSGTALLSCIDFKKSFIDATQYFNNYHNVLRIRKPLESSCLSLPLKVCSFFTPITASLAQIIWL